MANPFWFQLIKDWKVEGMGQYGVSFPFLAGAIAKKYGGEINEEFVKRIFLKIIEHPATEYYCEVRWCHNIDEPVVSIESSHTIKNKSIHAQYTNNAGEPSLAFTTDLMSMLTLDCKTKEECLTKLINRTVEVAGKGLFSKNNGVFGDFTAGEIEFIENVFSTSSKA